MNNSTEWTTVGAAKSKHAGIPGQWEGQVTFISEEKGYISASKKRGGRSEPCFFYPQDLGCELKKGDYVCFDVNVNAKRQGHHLLKAFNVEAKGSSNNTQQAKTSARSSGVSNGDSASAHSTSGVRNNMEDLHEARMKRMEDMMTSMALTLSQRPAVAGSDGNQ